jgi:hypothetical protein
MDTKKLIRELKSISEDIDCNGFFACPGPEVNRIYNMRTCKNCAAVIRLRRLVKTLES